jgi:methylated-DNA-protein-cysteine methyltransferase related protein
MPARTDPRAVVDARAERILAAVRAIPPGFVSTYGDLDLRAPRLAGRVLATTTAEVPWHRVVRADGSLACGARQRAMLRREGVPMRGERVDMALARLGADSPLRPVSAARHAPGGRRPARRAAPPPSPAR